MLPCWTMFIKWFRRIHDPKKIYDSGSRLNICIDADYVSDNLLVSLFIIVYVLLMSCA